MTWRVSEELASAQRASTWQRVCSFIFNTLVGAAVAVMFAVMLMEFAVGCGEVTHFADGTWRTNECLFYPHDIQEGRWDE